jgi:hypothetical protein
MRKITRAAQAAVIVFLALAFGVCAAYASDRPSQIRNIQETPDATKGEVERLRSIYEPTGETVALTISYDNGTTIASEYQSGKLSHQRELSPHPAKKGLYLHSETLYNVQTGEILKKRWYRWQDGSLMQEDEYGARFISRTIFQADGKTPKHRLLLEKKPASPCSSTRSSARQGSGDERLLTITTMGRRHRSCPLSLVVSWCSNNDTI